MSTELIESPQPQPQNEAVDLFAPSTVKTTTGGPKGSEDMNSNEVILPRASLLQSMSKAITEHHLPGAEAGVWWLTPLNRPLNHPAGKDGLPTHARLVVAKIFPSMRQWKDLKDGGGLICEAADGTLTAREPNGLAGAKITVERNKKKEVTAIDWEGGHATTDCSVCVKGMGASMAARGHEPNAGSKDRGGVWLPKTIVVGGESIVIPDKLRAPPCTPGIDILALVLVPGFGEAPAELMPVLISFTRTSFNAGKQLSSLIKFTPRDPAWSRIYQLGSQITTNDSGTFYIATTSMLGYTNDALAMQAEDLYDNSKVRVYQSDFSDEAGHAPEPATQTQANKDDAPPPADTDKF